MATPVSAANAYEAGVCVDGGTASGTMAAVAGSDRTWHWAHGRIVGRDTVVIECETAGKVLVAACLERIGSSCRASLHGGECA